MELTCPCAGYAARPGPQPSRCKATSSSLVSWPAAYSARRSSPSWRARGDRHLQRWGRRARICCSGGAPHIGATLSLCEPAQGCGVATGPAMVAALAAPPPRLAAVRGRKLRRLTGWTAAGREAAPGTRQATPLTPAARPPRSPRGHIPPCHAGGGAWGVMAAWLPGPVWWRRAMADSGVSGGPPPALLAQRVLRLLRPEPSPCCACWHRLAARLLRLLRPGPAPAARAGTAGLLVCCACCVLGRVRTGCRSALLLTPSARFSCWRRPPAHLLFSQAGWNRCNLKKKGLERCNTLSLSLSLS